MSDEPSGFSFGKPLADDEDDSPFMEEGDAIEVSGEPVSRNEAKKLGVVSLDAVRERKAATSTSTALRPGKLPAGVADETAEKMDQAWQYLKRNEIDQALTTAQEVVWEHPDLVAPKLIIARCFMAREEYEKALNLLQAIPNIENESEALYYIGLSQSKLGKIGEALKSLNVCRATTGDSVLKKRASDLIAHLQGEQTVCPMCGKKTLYDGMVDVGDQTVCADCAEQLAEDMDDGFDDGDGAGGRRRKRLRPPLSRTEILARVFLFVVIVGCLMAVLFYVAPAFYNQIRSYVPSSLRGYIPHAEETAPIIVSREPAEPTGPRTVPTMVFGSPPITRALAGVELNHKTFVETTAGQQGSFAVAFNPVPEGEYSMNRNTGELRWTPAPGDAGKTFTITFSAEFASGNTIRRAVNQENSVLVGAGVGSQRVGDWQGGALFAHMATGDINGDGRVELVVVSGDYWRGEVRLLTPEPGGQYRELARTAFNGGPAGAGLILADREMWVAVADFWNARIRYFAFRDGNLSELVVTIPLPGNPLLADFHQASSVSAALCRTRDGLKVVSFRQTSQRDWKKLSEWEVPADFVWRQLRILESDGDATPALALFGGNAANSTLYLEHGEEKKPEWRGAIAGDAVLADAAYARKDGTTARLFMTGETMTLAVAQSLLAPADASGPKVSERVIDAGKPPALSGMIMLDITGDGTKETVFFDSGAASVLFGDSGFNQNELTRWPLAAPPRALGSPCAAPNADGTGDEALYLGAEGGIWALRMIQ